MQSKCRLVAKASASTSTSWLQFLILNSLFMCQMIGFQIEEAISTAKRACGH